MTMCLVSGELTCIGSSTGRMVTISIAELETRAAAIEESRSTYILIDGQRKTIKGSAYSGVKKFNII